MSRLLKAIRHLHPNYEVSIKGADEYANINWHSETPIPEAELITAQQDVDNSEARDDKVIATKAEGLTRISAQVSALNTMDMVEFMVSLWPMLDTASAPAKVNKAKDIYVYAKAKINWLTKTAADAEVAAYDPSTDPGWPI